MRVTLSDSKPAHWSPAGHHYRVTLSSGKRPGRLTFDFWGSVADKEAKQEPTTYDVLACLSSDVQAPKTFKDYCSEYGGNEDDTEAVQTFRRLHRFAEKLREFFSAGEIAELGEIQ